MTELVQRNFRLAYLAVTIPTGLSLDLLAVEGFRSRVLRYATRELRCCEVRCNWDFREGRTHYFCGKDGWETRMDPDEACRLWNLYTNP